METTKLWHAINESQSLEESLRAGNMSGFLMLEDSVEAIEALNTQVNAAQQELKQLLGVLPAPMTATKTAVQTAQKELAAMRLKPDPMFKLGKLRDPVAKAGKVMANAQTLTSTMIAAGQTVMGTLSDLGVQGEGSLSDVLKSAAEANPDANIPDEKAFLGAVKKSWQPPKGAMGAIKGFLSSMGIGKGPELFGLTAETFAADMMKSSISELQGFLDGKIAKDALVPSKDEPVAQLDDQVAAAGLTPAVMQGKEEAPASGDKSGEKDEKADGASTAGKKWSDISSAYLKTVDDQAAGKKFLDSLKADKGFASAVAELINLDESMYRRSLSALLFEAVEFDVLKSAASSASDDEGVQVQLARGLATVMTDQGIEVKNVPAEDKAEEKAEDDEVPVADEKEAKEEQAEADAELKSAVKGEVGQSQTPKDAAFGALDAWTTGLSATSQKSLTAKNRIGDLKDVIGMALDDSAKAVEGEVAAAIQAWRDDHEETLMKSKRFAKKNFDALQQLIPKLASTMLQKSNESVLKLTRGNVRKIVFEFLNRKFYKNSDNVLSEHLINRSSGAHAEEIPYAEDDMVRYRWLKMAGLGK